MVPRSRKKAEVSPLVEALRFVAVAQLPIGNPFQTHTIIQRGWAVSYDGTLAIGAPVQEDIDACPHTMLFLEAITKCSGNYSIVKADADRITIKSDRFKVVVPCALPEILAPQYPDPQTHMLNEGFIDALDTIGFLASETGQHVVTSSVLVRSGSCIATDRRLVLEYWHGNDLPVMQLPKVAVAAICKAKKLLVGLGYSGNTATFYFDDGSWIRSQLHPGTPAPFDGILNKPCNPWPIPAFFFDGVRAIAPFAQNNAILFGDNLLRSHQTEGVGATFEISGIPKGACFNSKVLLDAEPFIATIDFAGDNEAAYFFGPIDEATKQPKVRGLIAGIRPQWEPPPPPTPEEQIELDRKRAESDAARKAKHEATPWYPGKPEYDPDISF